MATEINQVVELEKGLWLAANDAGKPELYWQGLNTDSLFPAGLGTFSHKINGVAKSIRASWLARIEQWQADRDSLRACGDCRYQAASTAAQIIKSVR